MRAFNCCRRPISCIVQLCLGLLSMGNAISAETLFDPTQPHGARSAPRLDGTRTAPASLQLEAILHGSQRRLAIINGQLVREGDRIANNLIERIAPTSVRYSRQGQQHTLQLAGAVVAEKHLSIRPSALTQLAKEQLP